MKQLRAVTALALAMAMATQALAVDTFFTATLDGSSPTWTRGSGGPGPYPYLTISMVPTVTGFYDIINTNANGIYDPYLYVYTGVFDVNNPSATYLTEDDDSGGGPNWRYFRISNLSLTAGQTYVLVPTVYNAGELGSFDFKVSGAGSVSAVVSGGSGGTGPSATDITDPSATYLASDLGATVNAAFDGGTLNADATNVSDSFTITNAGGTIQAQNGVQAEFSGVISDGSGANGALKITNTGSGGSITLTAANTYTGATTIENGATLVLSGGGSITSSAVTVDSGATLNNTNGGLASTATLTNNGTVSLGANDTISSLINGGTLNGSSTLTASTYTLNGGSVINANLGAGAITSNGLVKLNGTSGASTIAVNSGTLELGSANRLSTSSAVTVTGGSTLKLGGNETIGSLNGAGAVTLGANALTLSSGSFAGVLSGAGSLTKQGAGTLTLSGNNLYTGATTVSAGTLTLDGSLASSSISISSGATLNNANGGFASGTTLTNDGTVLLGASQSIASLINSGTLNGSSTLTASTYALNGGSVINANLGAGVITSNGLVKLNGTSGASTIAVNSGKLELGSAGRLATSSTVSLAGGSTLKLGGDETIDSLNGAGAVTLGANALTLSAGSFGGVLSGTGSLTKQGAGSLTLSGNNLYTGATTVSAGTLTLDGSLASLSVSVGSGATLNNTNGGLASGATLSNAGTVSLGANQSINSLINSGTVNGSSTLTASTYALNEGSIINANLGGGSITSSGLVKLNGTSGASTISLASGTLELGSANRLAASSALTLAGGSTLKLGGNETVSALNGVGGVSLGANVLTLSSGNFGGVLSGAGSLTKQGAGTLTLSGNNLLTGATTVSAGALTLDGSLASASISVSSGATLSNTNGGLANNATLTNDGTVSLGANQTIGSLINTGTLNGANSTLTASTYALNNGSVINAKLGAGAVTTNGTVKLNGTSGASTIAVSSGTLELGSANRLASSAAVTLASGSMLKLGGSETIGSLSGNGSAVLGANALTLSSGNFGGVLSGTGSLTKQGAGSLTLAGSNLYTGATHVQSGTVNLTGGLAGVSINVASGATLNNSNGGLTGGAILTNAGTVSFGANQTIAALVNSGTLNGSYTLTSSSYLLNDGSVINAKLGAGLLVSNGSVLLNNTSAAETIQIQTGALTLGGANLLSDDAWVDVASQARLVLSNGNDTIRLLTGDGRIDLLNSSVLTVREGSYGGSATSTGALLKDSAPILTLSGNNTYEAGTIVRRGEINLSETGRLNSDVTIETEGVLRANGVVQGGVQVDAGGQLFGSGTIASNVVNYGTTAPGNSPGILTVAGDYTEHGILNIEIDGRAGAGVNPDGHDQLKVGGTVTLNSGSTLLLTRSVANGFEPVLGDRFLVIDSAGGINGSFSYLDRSAYSTKLLFDYGTGYVHGTGVGSGEAFTKLGVNSENARSMAALVSANGVIQDQNKNDAFIDSRTASGKLFKALLESSSPVQSLENLSPSPYAGLTEYALRATRHYARDAALATPLATSDGWFVTGGYTEYSRDVKNGSSETDFALRSKGGSAGLARRLGNRVIVGGFYAQDDGSVSGRRLAYDASGFSTGVHASMPRKSDGRFSASAGASYGSYDFEGMRSSMITRVDGETKATSYDVWTDAQYLLIRGKRVSLSAIGGVGYTLAYVDGFSEKGGVDAFRIHGQDDELFIGELGAEVEVALTKKLFFVARGTQSQNFQDSRREVYATFLSGGGRARVVSPGIDEKETDGSVSLRYGFSDHGSIGAYYETNLAKGNGATDKFGVRAAIKF